MDKIIFVDDDIDSIRSFSVTLRLMFKRDYQIICPPLEEKIEDMLQELDSYDGKLSYFIDENLKNTGIASYSGTELINHIRRVDSKIPIYILTTDPYSADEDSGDIEYLIDKKDCTINNVNLAQRFLRRIDTYKDIKNKQAQRFDALFDKSLSAPLTASEKQEFEALNLIRSKKLIEESIISEESLRNLERKSEELESLYQKIKEQVDAQ